MTRLVDTSSALHLPAYEGVAHLAPAVLELKDEARRVVKHLEGRTVWMINSTAQGGGVAEMLPTMVTLLTDLGIETKWAVIDSDDPKFFRLTKQLHNMIHGEGNPSLESGDRELYDAVNRANAEELLPHLKPKDILVVHDPQPMALAKILREKMDLLTIWRCHIGLDEDNAQTKAAWDFLAPYGDAYDWGVFSAPEYIPDFMAGRSVVIYPAINPLSLKNTELPLHKIVAVLANSGLAQSPGPLVTGPYEQMAKRLQTDGTTFLPANIMDDIGLLTRPIITQISRWDRLKGFLPVLKAFGRLKALKNSTGNPLHRRRRTIVRLVLAGPDPESIQDDPEAVETLDELCAAFRDLESGAQADIALVTLPMASIDENWIMVNALQRASTIVIQNSIREGFGLTVTEAMWKRVPVLTNSFACGPRQQVRDRLDGRLISDPTNVEELAMALDEMLGDSEGREAWGRTAQRHVHDRFLCFSQLRSWVDLFSRVDGPRTSGDYAVAHSELG